MDNNIITLTCKDCGHEEQVALYCPYTGHKYGESFEYKCASCNGRLEDNNSFDQQPDIM